MFRRRLGDPRDGARQLDACTAEGLGITGRTLQARINAEGTMRFTQQALRLLFEVPGELERLTEPPEELGEDEDASDDEGARSA